MLYKGHTANCKGLVQQIGGKHAVDYCKERKAGHQSGLANFVAPLVQPAPMPPSATRYPAVVPTSNALPHPIQSSVHYNSNVDVLYNVP